MSHRLWMHITGLGDSAVLLPCIALVALWLAWPAATRGLAARWLLLALVAIGVVALGKLAFMGWGFTFGLPDFTGLSGHATMAAIVWPALGALLGGRRNARWQAVGAGAGWLLAWMVGWSRVVVHAHPPVEAGLGTLLGTLGSAAFLWRYREHWRLPERTLAAVLILVPVLLLCVGLQFPSEQWLGDMARACTGHRPYTRQDLRQARLHPPQPFRAVPAA